MQVDILEEATTLGALLSSSCLKITLAESCTGGGIAHAITAVPGSSSWFDIGFVTYSNQAKINQLCVKPDTLTLHGAVSDEVVLEMLAGALEVSGAHVGIAVSGIAGPSGATETKDVGTVYIAWGGRDESFSQEFNFAGDRQQVRDQAIYQCLLLVKEFVLLKRAV